FLGMNDGRAYAVYGAYTALVYATPFLGGMLADRLLGARRAVVWGGLLMAAGHALMTVERAWAFYAALALLICGNGFFKPNISTIVGTLYPPGDTRRDSGFTLFYMGINLGAALAPAAAAVIAAVALGRGGLPADVGRAPAAAAGRSLAPVAVAVAVALPVVALCVQQSAVAGVALAVFGGAALAYLLFEALRSE